MDVDEELLRAFVDGELDAGQRRQVEDAIAASPSLQDTLAALQASRLPYREAFDAQALPPVPPELVGHVKGLLADRPCSRSDAGADRPPGCGAGPHQRSRRACLFAGFAASFAAGACLPKVLALFGDAGSVVAQKEPWVEAIARYHALYVRETIEWATMAPETLPDLLEGFDPAVRPRLRVPDLAAAGLSFRRAQRLGLGSEPLIQLVYLPARGRPLAVCFLTAAGPASAPRYLNIGAQGVVAWRADGLAFVVAGDQTPHELKRLVTIIQPQILS
ncbi:anti-sigma factor family protein [Leptothrix sp. BB-4]